MGRSVVIAVDVSYSMSDPDPAAAAHALTMRARPTKLDVARAEMVKFLASLPPDVTVNVVAFSSGQRTLWPAPRTLDEAALNEAIRWIAGLGVVERDAPRRGAERRGRDAVGQIVMVTDGRPTYRETETALMGVAATLRGQHIRLDVVGVGADQDASFITDLAVAGGGSARQN